MRNTKAIGLMVLVTFLTSAGQVLWKVGAEKLELTITGTLFNFPVIIGLFFYGIGVLVLLKALKGHEVSTLYPVLALSYIWVSVVSFFYFEEIMNMYKIMGVLVIIVGVIVLGKTNPHTAEAP